MLAMLALAGCTDTTDRDLAAMQARISPTLSEGDAYFIDQATRSGLAELQAGNLAAKQASRPEVRSFAGQMASDHAKVNADLAALAQQKRIIPPTAPSPVQQQMIGALMGLSGAAFDRQYLDQQVAMHQAAISLFRTEAQQGSDPDVKAFAARALPGLEQYLNMAQRLGGRAPAS
jgi:putative membrane protein